MSLSTGIKYAKIVLVDAYIDQYNLIINDDIFRY